jgi:hypothetical protein
VNIDFSNDPGFSTYVVLLVFSGLAMLGLSSVQSTRGLRLLNLAFGAGFVCYGFYLAFLFQGGSYLIFFKAFILPVVMAYKTVKSRLAQPGVAPAPAAAHTSAPEAVAD